MRDRQRIIYQELFANSVLLYWKVCIKMQCIILLINLKFIKKWDAYYAIFKNTDLKLSAAYLLKFRKKIIGFRRKVKSVFFSLWQRSGLDQTLLNNTLFECFKPMTLIFWPLRCWLVLIKKYICTYAAIVFWRNNGICNPHHRFFTTLSLDHYRRWT